MNPDRHKHLNAPLLPPGHELLTAEFLREHGAVEGMKVYFDDTWQDYLFPAGRHLPENHMRDIYSAAIGTIAATLTPAPKGFRNVLPGWLAEQREKPEGLIWGNAKPFPYPNWKPCTAQIGEALSAYIGDPAFVWAVPISTQTGKEGDETCAPQTMTQSCSQQPTSDGSKDNPLLTHPGASNAASAKVPSSAGSGQWIPIEQINDLWLHAPWFLAHWGDPEKAQLIRMEHGGYFKNTEGIIMRDPTHFHPLHPTPEAGATRETDAKCGPPLSGDDTWPSGLIPADFARRLERERDEARKNNDRNLELLTGQRKKIEALRLDLTASRAEAEGLRAKVAALESLANDAVDQIPKPSYFQ